MSPAMQSMGWPLSNFMNSLTKKALLRDWRRRKFSSLITSTDVVFNYSPLVFPALTFRVMVSFNNNKTNKHKREKKKMKKCYLIFFFAFCVFFVQTHSVDEIANEECLQRTRKFPFCMSILDNSFLLLLLCNTHFKIHNHVEERERERERRWVPSCDVLRIISKRKKNLTQVKPVDPHKIFSMFNNVVFLRIKINCTDVFCYLEIVLSRQPLSLVFYLICNINLAKLLSCLEIDSKSRLEMFLIFSQFYLIWISCFLR